MGSRAEARRGLPLLLLVMALLIGALFAAGLVAAQDNSVGAPNSHGGTFAPMATPPGCVTGWRIVDSPSPDPQSSELYKVDALSSTDMWAVGVAGRGSLIEHWDGSVWSVVPSPVVTYTRTTLFDVAAVSTDDVWAVGYFDVPYPVLYQAATMHWNGATWSTVPVPEALQPFRVRLSGVDGVSANDVWAVGYVDTGSGLRALILHWDGTAWSLVSNPMSIVSVLNGVVAIASNDVWAVGVAAVGVSGESLLMHWDGTQWSEASTASSIEMYDVSAVSSTDVWATGFNYSGGQITSAILHWNGTAWTQVFTNSSMLMSVVGISSENAWVVGSSQVWHWNGSQWSLSPTPRPYPYGGSFLGVTATSPSEVWAVGRHGINGGEQTLTMRYTALCPPVTPTPVACSAGWTALDSPNGDAQANTLRAIRAVSPSDIWAVGAAGPNLDPLSVHWDGYAWSIVPMPSVQNGGFPRAIDAVTSNDIWAVGWTDGFPSRTLTMHWNGSAWSIVPSPNVGSGSNYLSGVAAVASNDVWAVGSSNNGTLAMHWNGTAWSIVSTPSGLDLISISAVSTNDVWAVGHSQSGALTLHWNGSMWSVITSPGPSDTYLNSVVAISTNDVWAVGYTSASHSPLAMHWDGNSWSLAPIAGGISGEFHSVSAALGEVWAVGETYNNLTTETLTMRWDGSQWVRETSPNVDTRYNTLNGVTSVSLNEVWAVGDQGWFSAEGQFTLIERYIGSCVTSTATATAVATSTTPATASGTPISATSTSVTSTQTGVASSTAIATATGTFSTPATPMAATASSTSATSTATSTLAASSTAITSPAISSTTTPTSTRTLTATSTSTSISTPTTASTATSLPTSCAITFSDVPTDNTFYLYIRCLACRGLVSGYADGTFRPDSEVTRGQLSKIVANAADLSALPTGQTFEDVPASHTFYVYIERMAGMSVIGGYPCGIEPGEPCVTPGNRPYFRPGANATRGQIAKIISNTAGYNDTPNAQTFQDVAPDSAFYVWIERLASRGIMSGYPCGGEGEPCGSENKPYFRAYVNATRGQVSKIVANTFLPGCQTTQR